MNPDEKPSEDSAQAQNGYGAAFITCLLCVIGILTMLKALMGFRDWGWCEHLAFILVPAMAVFMVLYRSDLRREASGTARLACLVAISLLILVVVLISLFFLVFLVCAFAGISRCHP